MVQIKKRVIRTARQWLRWSCQCAASVVERRGDLSCLCHCREVLHPRQLALPTYDRQSVADGCLAFAGVYSLSVAIIDFRRRWAPAAIDSAIASGTCFGNL